MGVAGSKSQHAERERGGGAGAPLDQVAGMLGGQGWGAGAGDGGVWLVGDKLQLGLGGGSPPFGALLEDFYSLIPVSLHCFGL